MRSIEELVMFMNPLNDMLVEAVGVDGKFNKQDSWKTLQKIAQTEASHVAIVKYANSDKKLMQFIEDILNQYYNAGGKLKHPFVWASGKDYIKLPYDFTPIIKSVISKYSDILIIKEINAKKIEVFYTGDKKKVKLIETGRGSVGKMATELQESSTCALFNAYMMMIGDDDDNMSMMDDLDNIKNILIDALGVEGDKYDETWLISFSLQIKSIVTLLKSYDCTVTDYRAARYGDKSDAVSAAYTKMIDAYTKACSTAGGRKDTYDPSDIILYDQNSVGLITEICVAGKDLEDYVDPKDSSKGIKGRYINELFNTHLCMGISLKKLSGTGRPELFNTGSHNVVSNVKSIVGNPIIKPNYTTIKVEGQFNFDHTTTDDGDNVKNQKNILITLREFGANVIAMDVKMDAKGEPALGKCPVEIWRGILGVNKRTKLHDCLDAFNKFLEKIDAKKLNDIQSIIQYAIKEGPHCYPFILLH